MQHVLLLLDDFDNRRQLQDWLSENYHILVPTEANDYIDSQFDIAIVDSSYMSRCRDRIFDRKQRESPAFLPFLLLATQEDIKQQHDIIPADEIIACPLNQLELTSRLNTLLALRHNSIEIQMTSKLSEALQDVNKAVSSATDLYTLVQNALEVAAEVIQCDSAGAILKDGDGWVVTNTYKTMKDYIGTKLSDSDVPYIALASKTRQTTVVEDAYVDGRTYPKLMKEHRIRSVMVTPLIVRDEVIGVLSFNAHNTPIYFSDAEVVFAGEVGTSVSLAVENLRLFESKRSISERFERIVGAITEGILLVDLDGRIIYANQAANTIMCPGRNDLLSRKFNDPSWQSTFMDGSIIPDEMLPFNRVLTTEEPVTDTEYVLIRCDGSRITISSNAVPYRNKEGRVIGAVVTLTNITERKEAEQRFQAVFDFSLDGMVTNDNDGKFIDVNSAAAELIGLSIEQIKGRRGIEFVAPDYDFQSGLDDLKRLGRLRGIIRILRADGTVRDVEFSAVTDVMPGYHLSILRDVTESKQQEQFNEALNDINTEINSTFEFDEIMRRVSVAATKAIGCEAATIILHEEDCWTIRYAFGFEERMTGKRFSLEDATIHSLAGGMKNPIVINDAYHDERVNLLLMRKFKIRSVLAVPLIVRGEMIGTLDFYYRSKPTTFTPAQVDFANKISSSVSLALENVRLYEAERKIADSLQRALLVMPETIKGVEFGYLYQSAAEAAMVGGDFYDMFELDEDRVGIVIGDVAGKGLEAATLTSLVKHTIRAFASELRSPATIMEKVNKVIINRNYAAAAFVTVFFGILNIKTGKLVYCCAGHPPAILKRATQDMLLLEVNSPIIGAFPGMSFYNDEETILKGDLLFLYTDGVTEARCDKELFDEERLIDNIRRIEMTSASDVPHLIFDRIMDFTDGNLADDMAILSIERNDKP